MDRDVVLIVCGYIAGVVCALGLGALVGGLGGWLDRQSEARRVRALRAQLGPIVQPVSMRAGVPGLRPRDAGLDLDARSLAERVARNDDAARVKRDAFATRLQREGRHVHELLIEEN